MINNGWFYFVALAVLTLIASSVSAVPPGENVEYVSGKSDPVIFSGDSHARKKLACKQCHTKLFKYKKHAVEITFADHSAGADNCFACHNGKMAFKSEGNCKRCHQKKN